MVYADNGDARRASDLLEKLTKKDPNPRSFAMLATSYEQMHDYALAATAYKQALNWTRTGSKSSKPLHRTCFCRTSWMKR